jgi:Kef-type K+ transport system membrane component KefB
VSLLLLLGALIGGPGFDLIPSEVVDWYEPLSMVALTMVAFLLGGSLSGAALRNRGRAILWVSMSVVLATVVIVSGGLILLGVASALAVLLAAIATATDPAATQDTLDHMETDETFASTIRGVVAIDDAWGMIVFALAVVFAQAVENGAWEIHHLGHALWDVGGGLLLGVAIGLPGAVLTGRLARGAPSQTEALGLVFLTAGAAHMLEVSYLLAGMVAGATIVARAKHHDYAFHEIEHVEWPFLMLFFLLSGASLDAAALLTLGGVGLAYLGLRVLARLCGGWIGGVMGGLPGPERRWIGAALLPQAGVAVGMGLVAAQSFPQYRDTILTLVIGATVVFEIVGPVMTACAARRTLRGPDLPG